MWDFLVGPSTALSNGYVLDGRIWWKCPVREVEKFEESAGRSGQSCSASTVGYQIEKTNCGKASLL